MPFVRGSERLVMVRPRSHFLGKRPKSLLFVMD
jgi:hypothetical protein